jgi:hypothetical protein
MKLGRESPLAIRALYLNGLQMPTDSCQSSNLKISGWGRDMKDIIKTSSLGRNEGIIFEMKH